MELPTELFDYVALNDPSYCWSVSSVTHGDGGAISRVDVDLVSQTWRSMLWRQRLVLFIPNGPKLPTRDTALLIIGADGPCSSALEQLGRLYAQRTGLYCAFLLDVPN